MNHKLKPHQGAQFDRLSDNDLAHWSARAAMATRIVSDVIFRSDGMVGVIWADGRLSPWKPLADNAICLTLVVELQLTVTVADGHTMVCTPMVVGITETEDHNGDKHAATCRAITRVAAGIAWLAAGHNFRLE